MSKKLLIVIIALLLVVCGVSTYIHIKNKNESEENKKTYETVAAEVAATEDSTTPKATEAPVNPYTDAIQNGNANGYSGTGGSNQNYSNSMTAAQNPDMVGWIKINGTNINYPVMQTKENPDYYLNHDFYKNESVYGCPYVQANCDVKTPSDNVIIYAHHMNDGSMFANLELFRSKDFWSSHKTISFDTLDTKANYDILAVFAIHVDQNDKNTFKFYEFVNSYDPDHFSTFVAKCKALSFYETGVSAKYGDKLLTLATCEYTNENGRLVVVAKRK
ncbi:MAG: class B sortase [Ruminococcus sp.]|nr:class B sortase [Ruminococcus sp.]